jgi:hypothetical protein
MDVISQQKDLASADIERLKQMRALIQEAKDAGGFSGSLEMILADALTTKGRQASGGYYY